MSTIQEVRVPRVAFRTAIVTAFWVAAAVLVVAADRIVDPWSVAAGVTVKVAAIFLVSFAYMRLAGRHATVDHALIAGAAWLAMNIVAEVTATKVLGHGWFGLIGSPGRPVLRQLLLIVWILAPAAFARHR